VHPPLYFWLLHYWRLISGDSEFGLRLLSVMFGLLTIAAAYLLGKRINGRFTGLLAALFMTISRFDISWSQEMRMYALAALLGRWRCGRRWGCGNTAVYATGCSIFCSWWPGCTTSTWPSLCW
jgi:uncharacterized membrane protein